MNMKIIFGIPKDAYDYDYMYVCVCLVLNIY